MDVRPVYKDKYVSQSFDNTLYFYARFNGNCPICLSYHNTPCVIPCGHTFCSTCLDTLSEFSRNCPVCTSFYWASRPVRFFFLEQISETVLFVRLRRSILLSDSTTGFFDCPYHFSYYESLEPSEYSSKPDVSLVSPYKYTTNSDKQAADHTFYQSVDGQLYFIDPKTIILWRNLPKYVYGTIKSISSYKSSECKYKELAHIPSEYQIHIVVIET
ncbi:hypothetical protein PAEPH01_1549 [Pancytospora epiphaga]|nr:hypothetical protein PAEPH01_1549 [Pancytospora epiphaga]